MPPRAICKAVGGAHTRTLAWLPADAHLRTHCRRDAPRPRLPRRRCLGRRRSLAPAPALAPLPLQRPLRAVPGPQVALLRHWHARAAPGVAVPRAVSRVKAISGVAALWWVFGIRNVLRSCCRGIPGARP